MLAKSVQPEQKKLFTYLWQAAHQDKHCQITEKEAGKIYKSLSGEQKRALKPFVFNNLPNRIPVWRSVIRGMKKK